MPFAKCSAGVRNGERCCVNVKNWVLVKVFNERSFQWRLEASLSNESSSFQRSSMQLMCQHKLWFKILKWLASITKSLLVTIRIFFWSDRSTPHTASHQECATARPIGHEIRLSWLIFSFFLYLLTLGFFSTFWWASPVYTQVSSWLFQHSKQLMPI